MPIGFPGLGNGGVNTANSSGGPAVFGPSSGTSTNNAVPTWNGVGGNQLNNSDLIYTSGILQRTGTNAFQLQDAASVTRFQWNATATVVNDQSGTNVIQLNSGSALFGTGTNSSNGRIQLAAATTSAGGIGFGSDTTFYRNGAGQLTLASAQTITALTVGNATNSINLQAGATSNIIGNSGALPTIIQSAGGTALTLDTSQNATFANKITTAAGPTSATPPWNLGAVRTSTALVVSTTQGIQVGINGVLFTLAVLTTNP